MIFNAEYSEVLTFWFGERLDESAIIREKSALWWNKSDAADRQIRERFARLREEAIAGRLREWESEPKGRLALIILVDQFSRNLFRDDRRAFQHDALARDWCVGGLACEADRALRRVERVFFYLPLEHSESLVEQERSVALYRTLLDEAPTAERVDYRNFLDFAERHRDIMLRTLSASQCAIGASIDA